MREDVDLVSTHATSTPQGDEHNAKPCVMFSVKILKP